MEDEIKLTIKPIDLAKAGRYIDGENCLLATTLKRNGYRDVIVYGFGRVEIERKWWRTVERFDGSIVKLDQFNSQRGYKPEVAGMNLTLRRV